MRLHRSASGLLLRAACALGLFVALFAAAHAASDADEDKMVLLTQRFGNSTGPKSIGFETYTKIEPGRRFMYANTSQFQSGLSGYTTTFEIQFPDSVVPDVSAHSPYATVVGDTVRVVVPTGGVFFIMPFDVKAENDLPRGATEIRMRWTIRVETPTRTLTNEGESAMDLVLGVGMKAAAIAEPDEVQLEDATPIVVTVRVYNIGRGALKQVAPNGDPTVAGGLATKKSGPKPASAAIAADGFADFEYVYTPTGAGQVAFTFPGFSGKGPKGEKATYRSVTTNQVKIKEEPKIEVTVETDPVRSLATDGGPRSTGLVRLRVTNKKGDPIAGQRVALGFPQFVGIVDLAPRLIVCRADGTRAYPPGDNATLLRAAEATTPANGEVTFRIQLGTQRRSTQLLVTGAVLDENDLETASDGEFIDLPDNDHPPTPDLTSTLDALQRAELPAGSPPDSPGVTGTGTPLEVLRSFTLWLLRQREAGTALPDFVPVTSQDQAHAGVLFYPRAQLQAVLAGAAVPGAVIVQIEDLGSGHQVTWQRPAIALADWETKSLNGQGLVQVGGPNPPRGPVVPAGQVVTSSDTAFLGYPYPSTGATGGCGPVLDGVSVAVHSPVTLLVTNAQGKSIGFDAGGEFLNEIPGAAFVGGEPAVYLLPDGAYTSGITGTGKGPATVVLSSAGATSTFSLAAKSGAEGTFTFDDTLAATNAVFNRKKLRVASGIPIRVTGVKKRLRIRNGSPLALTVTDVFGDPVAGARVHATGTDVDLETLTAADGRATMPLVLSKATKKLTLTIDGAGVTPTTLRISVKLLK